MSPSFRGRQRVRQAGYLTTADQVIPDGLVKITFLGEAESAIKLVLSLGLLTWTPFWASCLFKNDYFQAIVMNIFVVFHLHLCT